MTRILLLFPAACLLTGTARIPAFPGAEGFGAYAKGGRGGDVYVVTNLESSGPGSFYQGITTIPPEGRTVVFAVSGEIGLARANRTRVTGGSLTIAGQTAPGGGVQLRNGSIRFSSEDIIVRHLRFRHGKGGSGGDSVNLDQNASHVILDSISATFSTDENISSFRRPPENVTLQWSINAWGLQSHSCGGLWDQSHGTCHHTLWAHNHTRNPKARPNGLLEWTNNVMFDWNIGFIMGDSATPMDWKANVIGNYFICPPGNIRKTPLEKARLDRNGKPNFSVHVSYNLHDMDGDERLNGPDRGWDIVRGTPFDPRGNPTGNYVRIDKPFPGSEILTIDDPQLAYKKVVSKAGPQRLDHGFTGTLRDEVDTRLFENLTGLKRNHISRESDLEGISNRGFGTFAPSPAPTDTDQDGMPDVWETALGWDPGVQDHNEELRGAGYLPAGSHAGYTRLEEYLHFKSIPHLFLEKGKTAKPDIDLSRFTSGFTKNPRFTLGEVTGGTALQAGPGGKLVRFTAGSAPGRGGFQFTVTDGDGHGWTQQFAVCIIAP